MKLITDIKIKHQVKHDTDYAKVPVVNELDTPASDEAFKKYLLDTIAWLDSFDDVQV